MREQTLGDYLAPIDGQLVLLRGKYTGTPLDKVPRGYVREYILKRWDESLTEEEREAFQKRITETQDPAVTEDNT